MGVTTALAIGGVAGIGSGLMARDEMRAGRRDANRLAAMGAQAFANVEVPSIEEQKIILQSPDLMGQYTPEQLQFMELNTSSMENVQADPMAVEQQRQALQQMSEIAEGGLTDADLAAKRQIERGVGQQAVARRKAILNEMAQRGTLGSGMELAAQLQGEQQAVNQAAEASDRAIQQAQARSLQALAQKGNMASNLRQQSFGEEADRARARDAIAQFNLQNRQRVADTNIQERNRAQQINLAARQAQEDARVAARNQMEQYNKALRQQQFANQMQQASGLAGQYQAQAQNVMAGAKESAGSTAGIGSAIAGLAGDYMDYKKKS